MGILTTAIGDAFKTLAAKVSGNAGKKAVQKTVGAEVKGLAVSESKVLAGAAIKDMAKTGGLSVSKKAIAVIGVGTTALTIAGVQSLEKNGNKFTIIKYNLDSDTSNLLITYNNPDNVSIETTDTITITGSDTIPSLDGTYNIRTIVSPNSLEIATPNTLTNYGSTGIMTLNTTLLSQLSGGADTLSGALGKGVGGVINSAGKGLASGLGLDFDVIKPYILYAEILFIFSIIIFVLLGMRKLYYSFQGSSSTSIIPYTAKI